MAVNRDDGFLSEAISSILNQSFEDFEFIIVCNSASDDLWAALQKYQIDPRIRLFRTSISQIPFCLNFALENSRGELIARMDADDISHKNRFEKQINYFKSHDLDVLGGFCDVIDDRGVFKMTLKLPISHTDIMNEIVWSCPLVHPSILCRRDILIKARGYAYTFFAEDYELWLRLARTTKAKFGNLPEPIISYREHDSQSTGKGNSAENLKEVFLTPI